MLPDAPAPAEDCALAGVEVRSPRHASPRRDKKTGDVALLVLGAAPLAPARARSVALFLAVALLTCSYSLLLECAKNATGGFDFAPLSVTLVAEATKLAISVAAVYGAAAAAPPPLCAADCARAAVPALLYCIQNNLVFAAMRHLTPPLYQLLANFKIVATALLTRLVLHRALTRLQWTGVALLTLASALPGIAAFTAEGAAASGLTAGDLSVGTGIMAFVAFTSGLAGVLTERLLKSAPGSTHFKNMQLYAAGCALYLPAAYVSLAAHGATGSAAAAARGLFAGWTPLTGVLVLNLSVQGLAISFLLRWASNIEKLFAGAAALFVSMALSAPLFGYAPRPADLAGGALVCVALTAYHWRELRGSG